MTTRTCDCGKPIPDHDPAHICPACRVEVTDLLTALPDLVDDVNLAITRQTATGQRNGPRSSSSDTIAWNDAASRALTRTLTRLLSWTRTVAVPLLEHELDALTDRRDLIRAAGGKAEHQKDQPLVDALAARLDVVIDDTRQRLNYLTGPRWVITASHRTLVGVLLDPPVLEQLHRHPDAGRLLADLRRSHADLLTVTDSPPPRLYLGPCKADPLRKGVECIEEIYALDHSDQGKGHLCDQCRSVRCPTCGTEHDVAQRRGWLREAMDDRLATAGDIARGLATTTGVPVTLDQIKGWVNRGRLNRHGTDKAGSALYRVGDVIDLATEAAARRAEDVGA